MGGKPSKRKDENAELINYKFKRNERTYYFKIIWDAKHQEATLVDAQLSQKEIPTEELVRVLGTPIIQENVYKALIENKHTTPGNRFNIKVVI